MMNRSSFYSEYSQNLPQYKIIVLGLSGTGKTALLTRYQQDFYDDRGVSTFSVDFNITKKPNAWYHYYDTCGQQVYRSIVSHYYKGSDACIIAYDISSQQTFQQISYYYNQVKQQTDDALLYLVGCKSDLPKKVYQEDIAKRYKGIKHFITSAKTNKGVNELFSQIQKDLLENKPKLTNTKLKAMPFKDDPKVPGAKKGNQCCKN